MSNVHILTKETSKIMSLIYKAQKCRRDSKSSNIAGVRAYGEYLGVMACDINLICDAIMESKKLTCSICSKNWPFGSAKWIKLLRASNKHKLLNAGPQGLVL